jgi:hypothetical protein
VDDFLIDDENWVIRYLLVDTSNWLGGRRVFISPSWVREVSLDESKIYVTVTKEAVKNSPEYDPMGSVARADEERLYAHYGKDAYWAKGTTLQRLDESPDLQVADGDPDVKDWDVVSADDRKIGTVEHLIADPEAMRICYLEVGLEAETSEVTRTRDVLIPIEYVDVDESEATVRVPLKASTLVEHLPAFTGFPVPAEYDEQFRMATGLPSSAMSGHSLRLSRAAAGFGR